MDKLLFKIHCFLMLFNKEVIIFGAGSLAEKFLNDFPLKRKIICLIDNDSNKWGSWLKEKEIKEPGFLERIKKEKTFIFVASAYYDEIKTQLQKMGFTENSHFARASNHRNLLRERPQRHPLEKRFGKLKRWLPLGLFFSALLTALKHFLKIKIGILPNYTHIGHLCFNTEFFLRLEHIKGLENKRNLLVFCGKPANKQLLRMIKRRLKVIQNEIMAVLLDTGVLQLHPDIWEEIPYEFSSYEEFQKAPPQLTFTEKEKKKGHQLLKQMGLKENSQYICFHAKDKAYNRLKLSSDNTHLLQEYPPDFGDYRDCDINNYYKAVEFLATQNIFSLRMGQVVEKSLPEENPFVIDYASKHRSDFGDIYLPANCKFFLGSTSGLIMVSAIFNVPLAYTNFIPICALPYGKDDIFIPKKLWLTSEQRFLTFREIIEDGIDEWWRTDQYREAGIEVIENTPEEILGLVEEMIGRLNGTWVSTDEDKYLQGVFRACYPPTHRSYHALSRIGAKFLRDNPGLLK